MVDLIQMHASYKADTTALTEFQTERSVTWGELDAAKNRLANALVDLGIEKGDKVVVYLFNSIERYVAGGVGDALGVSIVPMNYRLTAPEVSFIIEDSAARFVVYGSDFDDVIAGCVPECPDVAAWICVGGSEIEGILDYETLTAAASPEAPEPLAEGTGVMIYTSGTTGKPKGAYRDPGQTNREMQAAWFASMISTFDLRPEDTHMVCAPLYHGAPFSMSMIATGVGSSQVILGKWDNENFLKAVDKYKVGSTIMPPILVNRLLDVPDEVREQYDLSSLHSVMMTGAACAQPVKDAFVDTFGEILYEYYGSTELGVNTVIQPADIKRKPNSCGEVFEGVEMVILDDEGNEAPPNTPGELFIRRHPLVFSGYHGRPDATRDTEHDADENLISVGDVAYVDEDGFYYICDRKSDMIISGGVNIYPAEIENVLMGHPAIADVAVFGIPNEQWGEAVHAAIELKEGASLEADDLSGWLEERLADYKRPRSLEFRELPRNEAGKLQKRKLRDVYWEDHESKVV